MSTELYFQIEARTTGRRRWWHFCRIRLSQDYLLFALLAQVRSADIHSLQAECLAPKGLPEDVTEMSLSEDSFTVDDEAAKLEICDSCSRADADEWVKCGRSRFIHDGYSVTHPEFHTHSWVTMEELKVIRDRYCSSEGNRENPTLNAALAMMESLGNDGIESRAVFWFGG